MVNHLLLVEETGQMWDILTENMKRWAEKCLYFFWVRGSSKTGWAFWAFGLFVLWLKTYGCGNTCDLNIFFDSFGLFFPAEMSPGNMKCLIFIAQLNGTPPTQTYKSVKDLGFVETIIVPLITGLRLYHYTIQHWQRKGCLCTSVLHGYQTKAWWRVLWVF